MLSIIIPTLNEEKYLPSLLKSIRKQKFGNYEIIIADAGSKDRTLEIAKKYDCKIIPGGLPGKGKNEGAKAATGKLLFFLDADSFLPDNFFEKSLEEFQRREVKIATFRLFLSRRNKFLFLLSDLFYNFPIIILEKILPHGAMGILVDRKLFEKLNGFDETIRIAEDHDLARRANKFGKYGVLRSTKIFVSERRFRTEGWIKTAIKYLFCEFYMILFGPIRTDFFKYKFNHYKNLPR